MAMVVATMFAHNQHRSMLTTQMSLIRQDVSVRATGVAVDAMEEIGVMAYDDATKNGPIDDPTLLTSLEIVTDENRLSLIETVVGIIGGEQDESGGADDVDDFNLRTLTRTRTHGGSNLSFDVMPSVHYVDSDGVTPVSYQTKMKRVTVDVVSKNFSFPDTVRLTHVISCGSRCAW